MDKNVFKDISYGLYIVSSIDKEKDQDVGCVINTLNQLTSTNPLVAICLNKENYTNEIIKKEKRFVVSILSEEVNPDIIKKFGFSSSKAKDKFAGEKVIDVNGIKTLDDAAICSYIECEVSQIIDVGSHDLFIGKVVSTKKVSSKKPMSYKYYYEVIKGGVSIKAPTYVEDREIKEEIYVCDVCGYVHYGKIPDDFKCPMCGVDASHFKKKE